MGIHWIPWAASSLAYARRMAEDLKRGLADYTAPRGRFELVDIPERQFLMVDGHGDPNTSPAYADALATLYPAAYRLKFFSKRELGRDYAVPPLEALWWAEDMGSFTAARDKALWSWTAMLLVPDWLVPEHLDAVRPQLATKGVPALDLLRWERLAEGLCAQTLHVGPYDDEGPVLRRMHEGFIPAQGLRMTGRHHEIYLGDPRRTAPARLRTILGQPVLPA